MIEFSIVANPLFYVVAVPALLFPIGVKLCWDGARPWIG